MKRITQERERKGWSRAELARRAVMHPSQVGQFESGRMVPYPGQVQRLAAALEWPAERAAELFQEVRSEPSPESGERAQA